MFRPGSNEVVSRVVCGHSNASLMSQLVAFVHADAVARQMMQSIVMLKVHAQDKVRRGVGEFGSNHM